MEAKARSKYSLKQPQHKVFTLQIKAVFFAFNQHTQFCNASFLPDIAKKKKKELAHNYFKFLLITFDA